MKLGLMQPYFLPYIGYFQLINAVDEFVVYDDIEYTKRGWINRNRFLQNGSDVYFTIPLKKDSDYLHVRERMLADNFENLRHKTLRRIENAYRKAPYFETGYKLLERCFSCTERNLYRFIRHSIDEVCASLGIDTPITASSTLSMEASLKAEERVLAICMRRGATTYVNPIGGVDLYDKSAFAVKGIKLCFIRTANVTYPQLCEDFVPNLSVIDVIMFNGLEGTRQLLDSYEFV